MATDPESRAEVPVLGGVPYRYYEVVCQTLANDWLDGKFGDGPPQEEKELMRQAINSRNASADIPSETFRKIYTLLEEKLVPSILGIHTSHRSWIQKTYQFLDMCGVTFPAGMATQVRDHDLSKYSPKELLGYALKFGEGTVAGRTLTDPEEKEEWTSAVQHHYSNNPHHPEFHKDRQGAQQDMDVGENLEGTHLMESVLDMLASHGERDLCDDKELSVKKWMDIDKHYFNRYTESDRKQTEALLADWSNVAVKFVQNPCNIDIIKTVFGERQVTVD